MKSFEIIENNIIEGIGINLSQFPHLDLDEKNTNEWVPLHPSSYQELIRYRSRPCPDRKFQEIVNNLNKVEPMRRVIRVCEKCGSFYGNWEQGKSKDGSPVFYRQHLNEGLIKGQSYVYMVDIEKSKDGKGYFITKPPVELVKVKKCLVLWRVRNNLGTINIRTEGNPLILYSYSKPLSGDRLTIGQSSWQAIVLAVLEPGQSIIVTKIDEGRPVISSGGIIDKNQYGLISYDGDKLRVFMGNKQILSFLPKNYM